MNRLRIASLFAAAAALAVALLPSPASAQTGGPYSFYAVTPCRAVDTRTGFGGVVNSSVTRNFTIQTVCGVPSGAKAVALNVTITGPTAAGFLSLWPAGGSMPLVSTINFVAGEQALANGAIVPLAATTPDLSLIYGVGGGSATVHVILDVTGYFQ